MAEQPRAEDSYETDVMDWSGDLFANPSRSASAWNQTLSIGRSLACELGPENITVNMVAPGWMADEKVDTSSQGSQNFAKSLPLRRHGSADEIGNACAFFLSDLAAYVTGAYLPVTGGRVTQAGV